MIHKIKGSILDATADVILVHGHGAEFCDGEHSTIQQVLSAGGPVVRRVIEGFLPMDPGIINHVFLRNIRGEKYDSVKFADSDKCIIVGSAIGDDASVIKKIIVETIRFTAIKRMKSIAMSRIGLHSVKITSDEWWETFNEVVKSSDVKRQLHNGQIDIFLDSHTE